MSDNKEIVIIGGGIIGCTTAYYLSHHTGFNGEPVKITVLEASPSGAAQGASGKAGGLAALWAYPRELVDVSYVSISVLMIKPMLRANVILA